MRSSQSILAGTVAGIALIAGAAAAQPGGNGHGNANEHGNGGGHGGGNAAHGQAQPGNGNGNGHGKGAGGQANSDRGGKAQSGNAGSHQQASSNRGNNHSGQPQAEKARAEKAQTGKSPSGRAQAQPGNGNSRASSNSQAENGAGASHQGSVQRNGNGGRDNAPPAQGRNSNENAKRADGAAAGPGNRDRNDRSTVAHREPRQDIKKVSYSGAKGTKFVVPTNDRVRVRTSGRAVDWGKLDRRVSYDGCPPGLAKKYNGCTPPGLDRAPTRNWSRPSWYWNDYNRDYTYRYTDGYMVRVGSGSSILSYIPLLAGALAIGNTWPGDYSSVALPDYYDDYYGLGDAGSYRYYGDTIYRVDPQSTRIDSVAALLTGNDIVVGQAMPAGYDIYNVPYGFRDQYYDTPDAMYRYSDGYIYQLDPTTRLVQAAIELLA